MIKLDQEALDTLGDPNEDGVFSVSALLRPDESGDFSVVSVNGFPVKYSDMAKKAEEKDPGEYNTAEETAKIMNG